MKLKQFQVKTLIAASVISATSFTFAMGRKPLVEGLENSSHRISDSLVKNLACATLTPENVLSSLQPDAFAINRHIPFQNWPSNMIAQCWSLSHTQRIFFYFGRFGEATSPSQRPQRRDTERVLNYIRGSVPTDQSSSQERTNIQELSLGAMTPFNIGAPDLRYPNPLLSSLINGIEMPAPGQEDGVLNRNFVSEIEHYQMKRFGNIFSNFGLLTGSGTRDKSENEKTMRAITADLEKGRIPLIDLRPAWKPHHIVLIKRMKKSADGQKISMAVYDSNFPDRENEVIYDIAQREFFAPSVVGPFRVENPYAPVGVFLVDDDDMDGIQYDLYQYYGERCRKMAE